LKLGVLLQAVDPPTDFGSLVTEVEERGFAHLLVADSSLHARDVYPYLTIAAMASEELLVGTGVTHPFTRHPGVTANAIGTIAELSCGRAVLGVGVGDRPVRELGLTPAKRSTLHDAVETWRSLTAGAAVSRDHRRFALRDARLAFPPASSVPVWIAASGPRTLALAGEIGDGVLAQIGLTPRHIEFALDRVREGAGGAGRPPPEFGVVAYGSVAPDRARARDESRYIAAWFAQTAPMQCELAGVNRQLVARIRRAYRGGELHKADEAARLVSEEMIDALTIGGTPDEVATRLGEFEALGVDRVTYMPMGEDRWGSIRAFAGALA
jgi:5,10-methylenetetrahydromethanopterin reductase